MELILATAVFGLAMLGMAVGVLVAGRPVAGSCGGDAVLGPDGNPLSCGACPRVEADLCPTDDNLVRLAQIANPARGGLTLGGPARRPHRRL